MGCSNGRTGGGLQAPQNEDLNNYIDPNNMERFAKFEYTFPLYRMRISDFEGKVKRFVSGKNSVSIR